MHYCADLRFTSIGYVGKDKDWLIYFMSKKEEDICCSIQ